MKFKSTLLTEASGGIAGLVFSHNKGGMYVRARTIPTNPASTRQAAVRSLMNQAANRWIDKLTVQQRADWAAYAEVVTLPNVLGAQIKIGPNAHYIRCWVGRKMLELPGLDDAPANFNLGEYTAPSFSLSAATQKATVAFTNTDDWANENGAALGYYFSRPFSPAVVFFKGPYRYQGRTLGNHTTPPESPVVTSVPFAFSEGQQVGMRVIVTRADGRLSLPFLVSGISSA